jgi:hypothetical protein
MCTDVEMLVIRVHRCGVMCSSKNGNGGLCSSSLQLHNDEVRDSASSYLLINTLKSNNMTRLKMRNMVI